MTYQTICERNKYLYAQLEHCSLMMGLALLNNQDEQYRDFLRVRSEINAKIDINLQLLEDYWSQPIIVRPANRITANTEYRNEDVVIQYLKSNPTITINELAEKLNLTQQFVERTITKYYTNKYSEVA